MGGSGSGCQGEFCLDEANMVKQIDVSPREPWAVAPAGQRAKSHITGRYIMYTREQILVETK